MHRVWRSPRVQATFHRVPNRTAPGSRGPLTSQGHGGSPPRDDTKSHVGRDESGIQICTKALLRDNPQKESWAGAGKGWGAQPCREHGFLPPLPTRGSLGGGAGALPRPRPHAPALLPPSPAGQKRWVTSLYFQTGERGPGSPERGRQQEKELQTDRPEARSPRQGARAIARAARSGNPLLALLGSGAGGVPARGAPHERPPEEGRLFRRRGTETSPVPH